MGLALLAALLTIAGVALSKFSFSFGEYGAVADQSDEEQWIDLPWAIALRGMRSRARRGARMLFDAGAGCVVAAVLLNMGVGREEWLVVVSLWASGIVLLMIVVYVSIGTIALWKDRREDAYQSFYDGNKLGFYYKNDNAIRALFFTKNPMPLHTIFRREWYDELNDATTDELMETNADSVAAAAEEVAVDPEAPT